MGTVSPATSAKIGVLSFAGIVCIALLHVPWSQTSAAQQLLWRFLSAVCPSALAFYFAFAGFFLARHWQEPGWWRRAVVKRVFSLVVPYLIWLLAFLCIFAFIHPDVSFYHGAGLASLLGLVPWDSPRLVPLWFLRTLFLFTLISPLVVKAIRAGHGVPLLTAVYALDLAYFGACAAGVIERDTPYVGSLFWYGFNLDGFLYFVLGVHLAVRPFQLPGAKTARACGCAAAALLALHMALAVLLEYGDEVYPSVVVAPFLAVWIWHVTPARRLPALFRGVSFPIYLMHVIVLEVYCHYRGWSGKDATECLLILALEIFVPLFVYRGLGRIAPRLAPLLFGGR